MRSPEYQFGAHPRLPDLEPALRLRWVPDPPTPALPLQWPVRLRPGWRFVGILNPVDQGGLIAPFRERAVYQFAGVVGSGTMLRFAASGFAAEPVTAA